jgi:acyl-CoA thioesterase FadM
MSIAVSVHVPAYDFDGPANRARIYTSQLDVRFLRPVYVPATAVIKAWCVARDGRKFWMRGQLIQEDGLDGKEGEGMGGSIEAVKRKRVCAEAQGFWVMTKEQKI